MCSEVKIKPEYPKTNIQVSDFSLYGYCFYQRVQMIFFSESVTYEKHKFKAAFLKNHNKGFCYERDGYTKMNNDEGTYCYCSKN